MYIVLLCTSQHTKAIEEIQRREMIGPCLAQASTIVGKIEHRTQITLLSMSPKD